MSPLLCERKIGREVSDSKRDDNSRVRKDKMKFKADINFVEFLKDVKKCTRDVYIETDEGDKLNLNSALSQYVFAVATIRNQTIHNCNVLCEKEDFRLLEKYIELQ